jgi:hypothetical protein
LNLGQGYVFDARTPEEYTEWFVNLALSFSAVSQTSTNILKKIEEAGSPGGNIFAYIALPPPPSTSAGFMAFFSPTSHTDSQTGATVYANGFAPIGPSLSFGTPSAGMTASFNVSLTYYWDISYYVNYAASIIGPGVNAMLNSIF